MAKREFLQLAHKYNPAKHGIGGWFMSEKLDGMRAFWDGGITRGIPKADVPWANHSKDSRYITPPIATGLWSRYGNVIHATDDWLDQLPAHTLDGELYNPDMYRQELMSIVKKTSPDPYSWDRVQFHVFDCPAIDTVFAPGVINTTNFKTVIDHENTEWMNSSAMERDITIPPEWIDYTLVYERLNFFVNDTVIRIEQVKLPIQTSLAEKLVADRLDMITDRGGEGLVLRDPHKPYETVRSHNVLKVKKLDDAEGIVTGYTGGQGKLLGMMGALILAYDGRCVELSGFTEAERELKYFSLDVLGASKGAEDYQGKELPHGFEATHFPLGTTVTFRYRGKSREGVPQEARYWRKR